jgi:glycosyltransferase involved in cell wall biosynthesis
VRIAIPIHSFEPGGVERVALRLADRWQADGEQVTIVLGRARGACRHTAPALRYRTLHEPFATERWETLWMIWSLLQFLLAEPVDVVFCPGNTYTVVCVMLKLLLGARCPPVLVKISNDLTRSDMPRAGQPFYRWWLRLQGALLERFVALAEPMEPEIARTMHIAQGRVACISDPALTRAEIARFAGRNCAPPGEARCRFLAVGRLEPQKNYPLLIAAFARQARGGDTLTIAGTGSQQIAIEAAIRQHDVHGRVRLLGHVDDIMPLFAAADVFALSSNYEGVPAALLEALAAGVPIAATACCASIEWLTGRGAFGRTVPCGDAEAFAVALAEARRLAPDRTAMRTLAARFTLESAHPAYLRELRRAADDARTFHMRRRGFPVREWAERGV